MITLKAEKRSKDVKAKRLRREGFVTGNLFGHQINGSIPLKITRKDADMLLAHETRGGQIMLDLDGKTYDVLIKEINFSALKREAEEIDFQALVSTEKVHSVAVICAENREAIKTGVLQELLEEIPYRALPSALVEKITVDVGKMRVGDSIKVKDLSIASDKDVDILVDKETVVFEVTASHHAEADEDTTEENK